MLLTSLGFLACAEPFAFGRHDLVDLRIVGMRVEGDALEAFAWEGANAYSAEALARSWSRDAVSCDGDVCGVPDSFSADLVLSGETGEERGTYSRDGAQSDPALGAATVFVDSGVATVFVDAADTHDVHWAAPVGELVETDAHQVDWTVEDEGEFPLVGLAIDGHGGNDWTVVDVTFGDAGPMLQVGNRLLPLATVPEATDEGSFLATIVAADNVYGFALDGLIVDDGTGDSTVCGVESAGWNADRLVDRTCGLDEVLDRTISISGTVIP